MSRPSRRELDQIRPAFKYAGLLLLRGEAREPLCPRTGSWFDKICNYHLAKVSNGPTEALNNLVERIKRIGFGLRNFENYRIRALLYAGKPNSRLVGGRGVFGGPASGQHRRDRGLILGGYGSGVADATPVELPADWSDTDGAFSTRLRVGGTNGNRRPVHVTGGQRDLKSGSS